MALESRRFVSVGTSLQGDEAVFGVGQVEAPALLQTDVVTVALNRPIKLDAILKYVKCFINFRQ